MAITKPTKTVIRLRALEPEDLDLLYRIENDEQLWGVGPTSVPYSRYSLHDYLANQSSDIYQDRQVRLVIEAAPDIGANASERWNSSTPVGLVDVMNFDPKHLRAEIGVVVEKSFRRQGIALQALQALHEHALHTFHLHQLYAIIAASNAPAVSLFQQAGYNQSARLADWLFDGQEYHDAILFQRIQP